MAQHCATCLDERIRFCREALRADVGLSALCARFQISRVTGYTWIRRFEQEGARGLQYQPKGGRTRPVSRRVKVWAEELKSLRKRHPSWGARKLLSVVQREHPRAQLPSERTVDRLLQQAGLLGARRMRSKRGPQLPAPVGRVVRASNEVWTVDFKGWFRVGVGERCEPLTVRDLYSRMLLGVRAVPQPSEAAVRQEMRVLFRRYGLPKVIRVDNGPPFGAKYQGGALGLTHLSAWWLLLRIEVEFTRRGCPQDNGAHEQMHRVLKAEMASPPAATLAAQQRRMERWRRHYNEQRPHEALDLQVPASLYRLSRRGYRPAVPWVYSPRWQVRRVSAKGTIRWEGRVRGVGLAFAGASVGLKRQRRSARSAEVWEVFFGPHLIGELHCADVGAMRAAQFCRRVLPVAPTTPPSSQTTAPPRTRILAPLRSVDPPLCSGSPALHCAKTRAHRATSPAKSPSKV